MLHKPPLNERLCVAIGWAILWLEGAVEGETIDGNHVTTMIENAAIS
jgi:hypothetical protein